MIELVAPDLPIMLQPTDNDAWSNPYSLSKRLDALFRPTLPHRFLLSCWYKMVGGEGIGSCFHLVRSLTWFIYRDKLFRIMQNMSGLMEERKPEVVIRLVSKAQLYQCLISQPTSDTAGGTTPDRWYKNHRHTRL